MSKFPFHTFIFGIFPIVFIYSHNVREIPLADLIAPLLTLFILILVILIIAKIFFENIIKFEIIFSIFLILFFSYGHAHELVKKIMLLRFMHEDHLYIMMCWSQILGISTFYIIKTKKKLKNIRIILNNITLFLIFFPLINIIFYFGKTVLYSPKETIDQIEKIEDSLFLQAKLKPDIYYIILDRYGNKEALAIFAKYDNSNFIECLESAGFVVASKSKSNYLKTAQSLASSLNFKYINYLENELGAKSDNLLPLYTLIKENKVYKILKKNGYKIIHLGSWWEPTRRNQNADINININPYGFSEFIRMICEKSWLLYFIEVNQYSQRKISWRRIIFQIDELSEIPEVDEPTFTFAHFMIPHHPFVFERNGNYKSIKEASKKSFEDNYLDQLIYMNSQLKELINKLISNSEHPPIIILQGDEGPFPYKYRINEKGYIWKNATVSELKQKMGILNAFYLPNIEPKIVYDAITPVNTFRFIFNSYFKTNYKILYDKSYAYYSDKHPYQFFDVTAKLNENTTLPDVQK